MDINYRKSSPEIVAAWWAFVSANPGIKFSVVAFVAGYNAAKVSELPKV